MTIQVLDESRSNESTRYRGNAHNLGQELVMESYLAADSLLPLVIEPAVKDLNLRDWAVSNSGWIETLLLRDGAVLFRNFDVNTIDEFEDFISVIAGELLAYSYRSTPRKRVSGRVYTSTEYPAHQFIPLHNENSYARNWPLKISFFCVKRADSGGETPIANSRKVYGRIPEKVRDSFARKKLMYVRNYGTGLDLSWQNVFQTTSKSKVERYCRMVGMECEWLGEDRLRTRQLCQAVATHPRTGETVWFNQAHIFHVSRLPEELREWLLSTREEDDLPRNVYYGDGSPIESSALDEISAAYEKEMVTFPWQERDILMLDNMLTAHGRRPFAGQRKIVVGMAEPYDAGTDCAA